MKMRLIRRRKATLPTLNVPIEVLDELGKVCEAGILENIKRQKTARGRAIRQNAPSTLKAKRRNKRPLMSLVDELHRFTRGLGASWASNPNTHKSSVSIEPATKELARLSRYVQLKRYTGWFGISAKARKAMKQKIREWLVDEVDAAVRMSRRRRR